jgi:ligand-binding SRPBCC domain-containing protein
VATAPKTFEHNSVIPTTLAALLAFHTDRQALTRLTPPPLFVKIRRDDRVSLTEGEVDFVLWFGPVPIRWLARHEPGPTPTSFTDRMIQGPLALWVHQHLFRAVPGGVELTDRITFAHPAGWRGLLTRIFFDGLSLRILFLYRHWRTQAALAER